MPFEPEVDILGFCGSAVYYGPVWKGNVGKLGVVAARNRIIIANVRTCVCCPCPCLVVVGRCGCGFLFSSQSIIQLLFHMLHNEADVRHFGLVALSATVVYFFFYVSVPFSGWLENCFSM